MLTYNNRNMSGGWYKGRKIKEMWTNGRKVWPKIADIKGGEMILNITTPSDNFRLDLFDYLGRSNVDDAIIDWGDGSDTIKIDPSTLSLSHTYSRANNYQLKISGTIMWRGSIAGASSSLSQCLTSIELPANNSPIVNIGSYAFHRCINLASIPSGLFDKCIETTSFESCFDGTSLQSIPHGLFDKCINVTDFSSCFTDCLFLESIPEGLFDNCTKVTNFTNCFYRCDELRSIPAGLFDNNTLATNFIGCFNYCYNLQSIPEGLFDNCPLITSFYYCFYGCSSLQSIPEHLFDNCINISDFNSCFCGCASITSKLPELWITHPTAYHTDCFNNCNKAPNYADAYKARWASFPRVNDDIWDPHNTKLLTVNILEDNFMVDLSPYIKPISNDTNIDIDWGDNYLERIGVDIAQHTYENKGEYIVEIYGDVEYVEPVKTAKAKQAFTIQPIIKSD